MRMDITKKCIIFVPGKMQQIKNTRHQPLQRGVGNIHGCLQMRSKNAATTSCASTVVRKTFTKERSKDGTNRRATNSMIMASSTAPV